MMIFSNNQVFWFRAAVVLVLGHWSIAAAQEEVFLGALSTRAHAVSGDVYLLSSKVIEIRGFTYDGTAPAVYFWADTNSSPSSHGKVLSDGFPSSGCAVAAGDPELPPSTRVTQRVEFPGDLTIFDFVGGSLSVWCEAFAESFGSLVLPRSLDASQVPSDGPSPECSVTADARTLQAEGSVLLSGDELETPNIKLWKAHGWTAAIAWGLLSPLAIAASVLRRFFPGEDTWYKVHRALNMMAVLFTIVSFVLAVVAVNQETPPGAPAEHFDDGHRLYGLVIFILAMLQAIGGAARPHLPEKPEPSDAVDGEAKTVPDSKSFARTFWEIGHRVIGLGILCFCWYQVQLGIKDYGEDYNDDDTGAALPVFWAVVGTMGSLILGGYALKLVSPE